MGDEKFCVESDRERMWYTLILIGVSCAKTKGHLMGQDSKRYIFMPKTGMETPKGIFLPRLNP